MDAGAGGGARRFAGAGSSIPPARLERAFARLDRETARESHRDLVARTAAGEFLDQAAAHCFVDPVAATDVVRWNHLRRQAVRVRESLAAGPASFGSLCAEREAPEVWASLPEPRHARVPAWERFRAAAEVWLDVHDGRPWTPPAEFPPPPAAPVPHVGSSQPAAATPRPAPTSERPQPAFPDETVLRLRERGRGLSL
jgi:hypothetical protein